MEHMRISSTQYSQCYSFLNINIFLQTPDFISENPL